jgi:tetratricopeptide (TPR) repeat protein
MQGVVKSTVLLAQENRQVNGPCDLNDGCPRGDLVPRVITPRNSTIFGDRLLLIRWESVENAISYSLKIDQLNINEVLNGQSFEYSRAIPIPPGNYIVEVTAVVEQNGRLEERQDNTYFMVLDPEMALQILDQVNSIEQNNLDARSRILQVAEIYESNFLYHEAIQSLENYLESRDPDLEIYNQLARLYDIIGLPNYRDYYQEKIERLDLQPITQ